MTCRGTNMTQHIMNQSCVSHAKSGLALCRLLGTLLAEIMREPR